jgi:hypothetical protein
LPFIDKPEIIMIIYRAIYLNSVNEIDKLNFGCHWTNDEFYANSIEFMYNDISEMGRQGNTQFLFKTEVNKNQIDKISTTKSNNEHSTESECVLKRDTILKELFLVYPKEYFQSFRANTGNRYDKCLKKL